MEILTREDLLMQKEGLRRNREIDEGKMKGFKVPIYSVEMFIATALALYDERDKLTQEMGQMKAELLLLKGGIEELWEKWDVSLMVSEDTLLDLVKHNNDTETIYKVVEVKKEFLQDLSLIGKGVGK